MKSARAVSSVRENMRLEVGKNNTDNSVRSENKALRKWNIYLRTN